MLSKLYHLLAIGSIAVTLALGALGGLLYVRGDLSSDKVDSIAAIIRGDAQDGDSTEDGDEADETDGEPNAFRRPSVEELSAQRRDNQLRRFALQRAKQDVAAQIELLNAAQHELILRQEQVAEDREQLAEAQAQFADRREDRGFAKQVELISGLAPKQAKEALIAMYRESPAEAVRLINALKSSKARQVLGSMKAPDEIEVMNDLLERIRTQQ